MLLDIFKNDAFGFTQLTTAINKIPYVPTLLGSRNLFSPRGVYTPKIAIEMRNNVLSLVASKPRGSGGPVKNPEKANIRDFRATHLPQSVTVLADEVMGIRSFGTEQDLLTAQKLLNDKMAIVTRDLDLTHEWQRMGAIKGQVLDADATTVLYDYFTEFGLTQQTLAFDLDVDATKVRGKTNTLTRMIEDTLGGVMMSGIEVLCSKEFFDALIDHPAVVDTYKATSQAGELRRSQRLSFDFGDCRFTEYRGTVGATRFIASGEAYAVPLGVPDLFQTFFAPADYMDAAGTEGVPRYMKMREMDFDRGVEWEVQSNPLHICTRPDSVIKLTLT